MEKDSNTNSKSNSIKISKNYNDIRTKLLILSNEENRKYLKENLVLFNSISPRTIVKKYENLEISIQNPVIESDKNYYVNPLNKSAKLENTVNERKISSNKIFENSILLADYLERKKISCSKKKMQRNSISIFDSILLYQDNYKHIHSNDLYNSNFIKNDNNLKLSNEEKNEVNKINKNPKQSLISNTYYSNENYISSKKNVRKDSSFFFKKKFFGSNNMNSNCNNFSKTIILNNLSYKDKLIKCRNIQKSFNKLHLLANSLKIVNNKEEKLHYKNLDENYTELFDILEYKGLVFEKNILNENLIYLNSIRNKKLHCIENNENTEHYTDFISDTTMPSLKNSKNSILRIAYNDDCKYYKYNHDNSYKDNNYNYYKDNQQLNKKEIKKDNYNTYINEKTSEAIMSNVKDKNVFISPKKNYMDETEIRFKKPPKIPKSDNSTKSISGIKEINPKLTESTNANFDECNKIDIDINFNSNKIYKEDNKEKYDKRDIKDRNQLDINDEYDQQILDTYNQNYSSIKNEIILFPLDNSTNLNDTIEDREKNYLSKKNPESKISKFEKGLENFRKRNSNISSDKKNTNRNFVVNFIKLEKEQTQNNITANSPNLRPNLIRDANITNLNPNTNNTLFGFITNERQFEYSNITSNSMNTNITINNNTNPYNNTNNTNNGYSSVSFYEGNSDNGLENYNNNSNYITNKNNQQNINFDSYFEFDNNIYLNKCFLNSNINSNNVNTEFKNFSYISNNIPSINESDYISDATKNSCSSNLSKNHSFITKSSCSDNEN